MACQDEGAYRRSGENGSKNQTNSLDTAEQTGFERCSYERKQTQNKNKTNPLGTVPRDECQGKHGITHGERSSYCGRLVCILTENRVR